MYSWRNAASEHSERGDLLSGYMESGAGITTCTVPYAGQCVCYFARNDIKNYPKLRRLSHR